MVYRHKNKCLKPVMENKAYKNTFVEDAGTGFDLDPFPGILATLPVGIFLPSILANNPKKMKMKNPLLYLSASLMLAAAPAAAQYNIPENNIWAIEHKAGIDFNSGNPVALGTSILSSGAAASVSDANGDLLFYTSGDTVWNKQGEVMAGGAGLIAPYSTLFCPSGALILPRPEHPNQYYVFSLEYPATALFGDTLPARLFYSLVDMDQEGGNGAVLLKGQQLDSGLTTKMIGIPGEHCGTKALWLLVRANDTNQFKAYEISPEGISQTPVTSHAGHLSGFLALMDGQIVVSPQGNRIAAASHVALPEGLGLEVYDFDPATGVVSNAITLDTGRRNYGVAFSPDGTKLYATSKDTDLSALTLFQYDLNAVNIPQSRTAVGALRNPGGSYFSPLRLGPNGKIYGFGGNGNFRNELEGYAPLVGADSLFCINAPDLAAPACDLELNIMGFLPGTGASYSLGNPYVRAATIGGIDVVIRIDEFTLSTTGSYTSYQWLKEGQVLPGATDSTLEVTENGFYAVVVTNAQGCTDTSEAYEVTNVGVGIDAVRGLADQIAIYPNPAREIVYIQSPVAVQVRLQQVSGQTILHRENAGSLNLSGLPAGMYFLRISDPQGRHLKTEKLILKD